MRWTKRDFKVDWFSGTGGGGQYRNRHRNCCRITHTSSGMMETGQSHRDRPSNQKEAFTKLARRMVTRFCVTTPDRTRPDHEERVRTYHAVRDEVIDHASGLRQTYRHVIENAKGDEMIAARRATFE